MAFAGKVSLDSLQDCENILPSADIFCVIITTIIFSTSLSYLSLRRVTE